MKKQTKPTPEMSTRTARRWRKAGVDPADPKQARDRLLTAKNIPPGALGSTSARTSSPQDPPPDMGDAVGPAAQLARLEADVKHLRRRLRGATGDPVLERSLRKQLLDVEDQLRKLHADGVVSLDGEILARTEAERILKEV